MSNALTILPAPVPLATTDQPIVVDELVTGHFDHFALVAIRISKTNRKRFNLTKLEELAASIKSKGVAQPILIRPVTPTPEEPEPYEIVAGERRFRAAIMAGLSVIPAMCRKLTDLEALELQILENLQRDNPHPLEEAEGYEQLMLKHGYNADQLALKLNKSRSYVYGRLKLCALSIEAREVFLDNQDALPASTALLIARIPTPGLQNKALQEILQPDHRGEAMSYRAAAAHIAKRYTLELGDAPFDTADDKLCKEVGSCTKCPKRTGNQPEIYADTKSADVCTDPDCFAEKKAAHYKRITIVANKLGLPVLEGQEAYAITSTAWSSSSKFATNSSHLSSFARVSPSTGMSGHVENLLTADELPKPVKYIKHANGVIEPVYNRSDVQVALEKKGACESVRAREARLAAEALDPSLAPAQTKQQQAAEASRKAHLELERRAEAITLERTTLYRKLRARVESHGLGIHIIREMAKLMVHTHPIPDDLLGDLYPFEGGDDAVCTYIDQADGPAVMTLMLDLLVGESLSVYFHSVDDEPDMGFAAVIKMAQAEEIEVTSEDLAVAGITVEMLETVEDVRQAIEDNLAHITAVCSHIVTKAPHHAGNVEATANALGYFYGVDGWKKAESTPDAMPPIETASTDENAQLSEQTNAPVRAKITLKKKVDAPQQNSGPIVKVKKDRAAQAAAALTPATAWPFPTTGVGR